MLVAPAQQVASAKPTVAITRPIAIAAPFAFAPPRDRIYPTPGRMASRHRPGDPVHRTGWGSLRH